MYAAGQTSKVNMPLCNGCRLSWSVQLFFFTDSPVIFGCPGCFFIFLQLAGLMGEARTVIIRGLTLGCLWG